MPAAPPRTHRRAPRKDPIQAAAELVLEARQQCDRGELARAVTTFENAILFQPSCRQAIHGRMALLAVLEAPETALELYADALDATGRHPEVLVGRGHLRLHVGDAAGALADYEEALLRLPGRSDLHAFRARAREACGELAGAIADYREAQLLGRPCDGVVPDAALRAVRLELELATAAR